MASISDHVKWLEEQLKRWVNSGIIQDNQVQSIRSLYPASQTTRPWALIVFSGIGAVIIGLGVILLFAYNWEDMSKASKLATVFLSLIISHIIGISLFLKSERFEKVGEALTILGTMLFGAGIWLIAQIYHIEEHFPTAFFIWGLGALAFAWAMLSIAQAIVAAILFTIWAMTEATAFENSIPYALIFILLLFPLAYKHRSSLLLGVLLFAFGISTIFIAAPTAESATFHSILGLLILYVSIGLIHQKSKKFENFAPVYFYIGLAGYLLVLYLLSFPELNKEVLRDIKDNKMISDVSVMLYWTVPLVLAIAGWIAVGRDLIKKTALKYYSHDLLLLPLVLIFFCGYFLSPTRVFNWPVTAIFNLVILAHIVMLMAKGCKEVKPAMA
ncbi:MAG: hypothetical protein A2173_04225, partial [Planctomycetes bacterium RBG_13_44_8b]